MVKFRESRYGVRWSVFAFVLICLCCFAEVDEPEAQPEDESGGAWTLLDTPEDLDTYRSERHRQAIRGLAPSSLSAQHQALLANAVTKMYSGTPVASFTVTTKEHSDEESTESISHWLIDETGRVRSTNPDIQEHPGFSGPFLGVSPVPFDVSTARIERESDYEVTFSFDFPNTGSSENFEETELQGDFAEMMVAEGWAKGAWEQEITVDKINQTPRNFLLMKLAKPLRKRFVYKFDTITMEVQFTYIERCGVHAVTKEIFEMRGAAIVGGGFFDSTITEFTDIVCDEPLRFLVNSD